MTTQSDLAELWQVLSFSGYKPSSDMRMVHWKASMTGLRHLADQLVLSQPRGCGHTWLVSGRRERCGWGDGESSIWSKPDTGRNLKTLNCEGSPSRRRQPAATPVFSTVSDLNQADSPEHRSTFSSFCPSVDYCIDYWLGSHATSGLHQLSAKWGLLLPIWRWGNWDSKKESDFFKAKS